MPSGLNVLARTWVWTTIVVFLVVNAIIVSFLVLGAVVAKRELGGAGAWTLILAAEGVGALVGGSALLRLRPRRPLLLATLVGLLPVAPRSSPWTCAR